MNIEKTLIYQMVAEQAKESSYRLQCTIYVFLSGTGKSLYQSQTLDKDGKILCAYNSGNEIAI